MKQKITDYLDEIYGGTFTATHLQKLVTRLESAKRLITQRRKKHWDESDVVLRKVRISRSFLPKLTR